MGLIECFFIGVGLSMDAFAASVCKGLGMDRLRWRQGAVLALSFGGFQALMPLLGWLLGRRFEAYITSVDHWIAFLLLGVIGGKMIWTPSTRRRRAEALICGSCWPSRWLPASTPWRWASPSPFCRRPSSPPPVSSAVPPSACP